MAFQESTPSVSSVFHFPASMLATASVISLMISQLAWAAPQSDGSVRVDVFTGQDLSIQTGLPDDPLSVPTMIEVYVIDGIQRLETVLSDQLPTDPNAARQIALARAGQIDSPRIEVAQRAALGLLTAVEYGIDRYPAVVIDGQAVVYGIRDIGEALRHFRVWQGRVPR